MKILEYNWAHFGEYCYQNGRNTYWNFDGWLGERLFKEGEKWRKRFFVFKKEALHLNPKKIILDLMCGCGYPSRDLAKSIPNNSYHICVDINKKYLEFAKSKAKEEGVNKKIDFVCADARYLPFKDKCVDFTYSIGGPEYFPPLELKRFLNEVKRITTHHTIFTFTHENFKKEMHYKMGLYHLRFLLSGITYHKLYTEKEIEKLLSLYGFKNSLIKITGNYHIIVTSQL